MKKPKTYNVRVTENTNGSMSIDYALNLVKINQHERFWNPVDKRRFTQLLKRNVFSGKLVTT